MVGYHLDHRHHHLAMINLFSLHFYIILYGKSTFLVKRCNTKKRINLETCVRNATLTDVKVEEGWQV